jgi:catechol 2,3-dioxygenase-like lactoylglutathione lyase family enzyme
MANKENIMNYIDSFGGISVDDILVAQTFYSDTLGLKLITDQMGLDYELPGGGHLFIYPKDDHVPAKYTTLNLVVTDLDKAVDAMTEKGVKFEHYPDSYQNEKGIMRPPEGSHYGPAIAWFTDPARNIIGLIEADK